MLKSKGEWFRRSRGLGFVVPFALLAFGTLVLIFSDVWERSPVCCDAVSYGQLAAAYQAEGLFTSHDVAKIRTYLYPALIALVQTPSELAGAKAGAQDPTVVLWQSAFFLAAVLTLLAAVRRLGTVAQCSVTFGLLCNIFILVYVPIRLTEIVSLSCFLIITSIAMELAGMGRGLGAKAILLFLLGCFIAGASVMIRPANVALAVCWLLFVVPYLLLIWRADGFGASLSIIGVAVAGALAFTQPLMPQWFINKATFGQETIFPVVELGRQQLVWGITHLKYTTLVMPDGAKGLVYPNPFCGIEDRHLGSPMHYYSEFPLCGAAVVLSHLFNSVTFDYLRPYVADLRPWSMPLVLALNHLVVFFGVVTGAQLIGRRLRDWRSGAMSFGLHDTWWLFLMFTVGVVCGLNSFVAVESRFGLPVMAILGPLCCYGLLTFSQKNKYQRIALALGALAYAAIAAIVSIWMLEFALSKAGYN